MGGSNQKQHPGVENLTRENFETVYVVYHKDEYGFGGNTKIRVAVTSETEDMIEGRRYSHMGSDFPHEKVAIKKENVAGWEEKIYDYNQIPESAMDAASEEDVRELYENGHIDEEELESKLEKVMS